MNQPYKLIENSWPKHLSYIPLSMGMIHPEWIYMSHFFDEQAEVKAAQQQSNPLMTPTSFHSLIQIHFRARK